MFVKGKHQDQSLSFNKVAGKACDFIKKDWHRSSPVNFAKFLQNSPPDDWLNFFFFFFLQKKNTSFFKTPLVAASDHLFFFIKYQISIARQSFHYVLPKLIFYVRRVPRVWLPEHFSLIRTFAKLIRLHLPHLYVFDFQTVTHCSG